MAIELSVAIMFKNEMRCIERCLKSLQILRERFSVEFVLADTGSTDGSRAVAERYADVLIDFPWVNDFAAARNATLEHCTGEWILVVDCDEWLAPGVDALEAFLHGKAAVRKHDAALVTIRNYLNAELSEYSDFMGLRLLRAASAPRYEGAIHEHAVFRRPLEAKKPEHPELASLVFYHDGYVMLNDGSEAGEAKRERNQTLLRQEYARDPDDLRVLMQYLEALQHTSPEYETILRRGMELAEKQGKSSESYGSVIFREAVFYAFDKDRPELREWGEKARKLYPKSYFTRIDVNFILLLDALRREEHERLIGYAESYLQAYESFPDDPRGRRELASSSLQRNSPFWAQYVRLRLASAYYHTGRTPEALKLLRQTDWTLLDARHTTFVTSLLWTMASVGRVDVGELLSECWNGINKPVPSPEAAAERVAEFKKLVSVEEAPQPEAPPQPDAPPELLELAAKVKALLDRFPPDDPAVIELKNSEAYQKVAYLIEG